MKRLAVTVLTIILFLLAFTLNASAESESVYAIERGEDGVLRFTKNGIVSSEADSLDRLLDGMSGLDMPIYMKNVVTDEEISLDGGDYVLTGSLTARGITVAEGTSLSLADCSVVLNDGIALLGGRLDVYSGTVRSDGTVVSLYFSALSRLEMRGGELLSASGSPTLVVRNGNAYLLGGRIENTVGTAIEAYTGLRLGNTAVSGFNYEIISHAPVFATAEMTQSTKMRVKYTSAFEEGTSTAILLGASAEQAECFSVVDRDGRAYDLTPINGSLAVHLPYTVKFVDGAEVVALAECLRGELLTPPSYSAPDGYRHLGWYTDAQKDEAYDFARTVEGDLTLYAGCELLTPQYSLSGIDEIYSGSEYLLKFTSLTHKLSGIYSYEWYNREGELICTTDSLSVCSVEDSGEYRCKLLFTHGTDSIAVETPFVTVTVRPRLIPAPTLDAVTYNGLPQSPVIRGSGFIYNSTSFTDAGVYRIELSLADPVNTRWDGSEGTVMTVPFEIKRAPNYFTDELRINDTYIGAEIITTAISRYGTPVVTYSTSPDGPFAPEPPSAIGVYYARAVVEGTNNYAYLEGETVCFAVLEDRVTRFTVNTHPVKSVYRSFDKFDPEGLTFSVVYASGKNEIISADAVAFSYLSDDSLRISHGAVVASFASHTCLLPVTVIPADYTVSVSLSDASLIFDGSYHTLMPSGEATVGLDGIPLEYTVKGGGTDAGRYTVTLEFYTDSVEYATPAPITATLEILPCTAFVLWGEHAFVYDGTPKRPTAYYLDVNGAKIPLDVQGAASLAGDGYLASAFASDGNYLLANDTLLYSISRADYDLSGAYWSAEHFTYSGESHTVTLLGLPEGVSVIGYINASATNAGTYLADAVLSYDEANYNAPKIPTHAFVIEPAAYDLSSFSFAGGEFTFDGLVHYPTLLGDMPVGIDGIPLSYAFSSGVLSVTDDPCVTVVFSTASSNYAAPDPITVPLQALPCGIYVEWTDTELVYNATAQAPTPYSSECIVYTESAATDVGRYTATAVTDDVNYKILNPTAEYRISPADNAWTVPPTVTDIFLGAAPSPSAAAMFGRVVFEYYTDTDLTESAALPLAAGKYYLVARADAGSNYKPLASAPIPFSVIPILPAALVVSGRTDFVAFEQISAPDVTITLVNNDGSEQALTLADVFVEYLSADSLRAGDECVLLHYGELSLAYPVSVARADYDTSGAFWSGLTVTYNGEPQYPTLSGLPSGVTVSEYIGVGATDAGEYPISVRLLYDAENYNEPHFPTVTLRIMKQGIIPELDATVYNRTPQLPTPKSELYTAESVRYTDAGVYSVKCTLTDDKNYYLVTDSAEFVITPAIISVVVSDADGYWFDEPSEFNLTFLDGFGTSREELLVEFYIEGDKILARAGNPNYDFDVTAGRLIKHNRFSPRVTRALFICFLLFILLASGIIILVLRREYVVSTCSRIFKRSTVVATDGGTEYASGEYMSIDVDRADELITDTIARTLIRKEDELVLTEGRRRYVVNVDTINESFASGERVDINVLKARGIIPTDAGYVKILGRGTVNKPLRVYANAFSLSAVKMLALTGGEVHRVKNK